MDYAAVTLIYQQQEADLDLPLGVSLFTLVPMTLKALAWEQHVTEENLSNFVVRVRESGMMIHPNETLAQAGVVDGDIIELTAVQPQAISFADKPVTSTGVYVSGRPFLQSAATGEQFPCRGNVTQIGRSPDCTINLTNLPANDVVSRRHANILRQDDEYWLRDEGSTNGTMVDGYSLDASESVRLRDGCQIQFGENGPILVFHTS